MTRVDIQVPSDDEDFDSVSEPSKPSTVQDEVSAEPEPQTVETDEMATDPETTATPETDTPPADPVPAVNPPEFIGPGVANQVGSTSTVSRSAPQASQTASPKHRLPLRFIGELLLIIAVVGLAIATWTLTADNHNLNQQVASLNANPQATVQKQTAALIAQVGRLMQLPAGETPTVAAVSDATQAKQQSAFFANAQNGDKVLLYSKAGEAILYRPSTNKIILVAPLTFTNPSKTTSGTATSTPKTATGTTTTTVPSGH